MDHSPLTVVWIAEYADPFFAEQREDFAAKGIKISLADGESQLTRGAELRVLPSWTLADARAYRAVYEQDGRPTLLLGRSADEVPDLLQIALDSDEVGHAEEPPAALVERLRRLQRRADNRRTLEQVVRRDELTSLWDRRRLEEALDQLPHQMPTQHGVTSLILLDLDHFKRVNDSYGHAVGDSVLRSTAELLRALAHDGDLPVRYGGEEFALLVHRSDHTGVHETAEAIRQSVAESTMASPVEAAAPVQVTLSAGTACWTHGMSPRELLECADMALYASKATGRNRVTAYETMREAGSEDVRDLQVRHFRNVTQVVTERVASLISLMGQQVIGAIQREADQDALTRVHNRRYFDKRISREFEATVRDGRPLAIAFLDIDNFGRFNRQYGAPTGDAVLRQFAALVLQAIRPVDWLARYGGEEFCVAMSASATDAMAVAERIRHKVEQARMTAFGGEEVSITVSIGIAEFRPGTDSPDALVQRASKALQAAKSQGRNCVQAG